jgi:uncharacterized protein YcaQ
MNRDDIIMMAREAGIVWADHTVVGSRENLLEHFANLIADRVTTELKQYYELTNGHIYDVVQAAVEAEREVCAKVCDEKERANLYGVKECADAIRARSEL